MERRSASQYHPRILAALHLLETSDLSPWRQAEPLPLLRQAIAQFNERRFFEQHETLEALWRTEPAPVRYLYQGILQVGVGFFHLSRGNARGAIAKLEQGLALLEPFEPSCLHIDVASLRRQSARCLEEIRRLGPTRLADFDQALIPCVEVTAKAAPSPDFAVEPVLRLPSEGDGPA